MKKKLTPDRARQVATTKRLYGEDHYEQIGSRGGKKSSGKFNSESGSAAVRARWAKARAEQLTKEKEQNNG